MAADILGLSFAAFIVLGGVVGYAKANSVASLASGLAFGALLALAAQLAANNSKNYSLLPVVVCLALAGVMGSRFLESRKFMPAGMVAATSLAMAIRYGIRFL
ncbi:TMEM14-domain-containing protein [Martensiomyces pterosporus]|nr:TMEM14-domain-containing protein [Martensiomyces pterosporus]